MSSSNSSRPPYSRLCPFLSHPPPQLDEIPVEPGKDNRVEVADQLTQIVLNKTRNLHSTLMRTSAKTMILMNPGVAVSAAAFSSSTPEISKSVLIEKIQAAVQAATQESSDKHDGNSAVLPNLPIIVRLPSNVCQGTRCTHVEYWKRLRAKKGISFFVCRLCGTKWRAPSRGEDCAIWSVQGLTPSSSSTLTETKDQCFSSSSSTLAFTPATCTTSPALPQASYTQPDLDASLQALLSQLSYNVGDTEASVSSDVTSHVACLDNESSVSTHSTLQALSEFSNQFAQLDTAPLITPSDQFKL